MRILFIPYSVLQVQLQKLLAENLKSRGHDVSFVDVSKYITYGTDHEKEIYRKNLGAAEYTLNTTFRYNVQSFFRVKRDIQTLLHKSASDCIVVGLDSDPEQRAVINIARRSKIPTMLVQDGVWIFRYSETSWHSIIYSAIRQTVSGIVRGNPKKTWKSVVSLVNHVFGTVLLGDIRSCAFGCGGCDRVGVFSDIVRDRLIAGRVGENSIFVTGCLASKLNGSYEVKKNSSVTKKTKRRLVVISQPLWEVGADFGERIFTDIAVAIGKLESLGWKVSIRLHPRETDDKWKEAFAKVGLSINCNISHNVDWTSASVVLGFVSTLLTDVMLGGLPLVIYDLNHPVISQEDFFGINGVAVCNKPEEAVESILMAESISDENLDKASREVAARFGLLENSIDLAVEMIKDSKIFDRH